MSLRLGIIGTGRIAARAVAELREVDGFEPVAVVNPNSEHARDFADKYGIELAFASAGELKGHVDAVYVASPHGTHCEYAKELLEAGIHVLCEKPMAFSRSQTEELFSIAADHGAVLMEGIKTAYCPGFKKIGELVDAGTVGDVIDVEAAFTRLTYGNCREFDDRRFGGAFTEFGTYTMLPVLRFLGTEGFNVSFMSIYENGTDGYTKAVFDYKDRFACAKTGLTVKSEGQLLISGTKGYILVPSPWWLTRHIEVRYEDPGRIDRYECEYKGDGLRYEFREFVKRINAGVKASDAEIKEAAARAAVYEEFLRIRSNGV